MGLFHRQVGLSRTGYRHGLIASALAIATFSMGMPRVDASMARFDPSQCQTVVLWDEETGTSVRGAESIILSGDGTTLFVSAYDRRSKTAAGIPPQGGLYAVGLADLKVKPRLGVRSIAAGQALPGGFRPHGLALHETSTGEQVLAVINRRYFDKQRGKRRFRPSIELFRSLDGAWRHAGTLTHPQFCRANDLAFLDDTTLITTIDRSVCADFTVSEDVLGFAGGHLLQVNFDAHGVLAAVERVQTGLLQFPNGIVADPVEGTVHVALTKGAAIATVGRVGDPLAGTEFSQLPLPGHPDNLSISRDASGRKLIVALYPSLPAFAAYRYRWFGIDRTASSIVAVDETGAIETLFEDPDGALFSAASSAILRDVLVAGSVGDEGLLVCATKDPS